VVSGSQTFAAFSHAQRVSGITRPVHIGRSTQVWAIELRNDAGELTCVSRITMAMLMPKQVPEL